jgi:hypothetical protein
MSSPKEEPVLLAHGVFSRTFVPRAQRHILLHAEAPEVRLPLLSFQVLGDALEVLPASAFRDKADFVPKVLGGLDVILDDKRAVG